MKNLGVAFISSLMLFSACTDNVLEKTGGDDSSSGKDDEVTISYTDSPNQSYFLIKANDETVDGKTVQVDWSNQEMETKSISVSDGFSNTLELAKIVNDRWTFPAVQFALDLNKKEGKSLDKENLSWYLPSKNELLLMHIYSGCLNLSEYAYWSSTEWANNSIYRNQVWLIVPNSNMTGLSTMNKVDGFHYIEKKERGASVRIVKKNDISEGKKYPYVKSQVEPIIVSRDKEGGVKESALRAEFPLSATTDLEENGVSRCFEVDLQDAGYVSLSEAKAISVSKGNNWRVPTMREMQLIWAMGGGDKQWGAYVPQGGLNLRDVQGFKSIGSGEFLISNPNYQDCDAAGHEPHIVGWRFLGSLGTILGGNDKDAKQVVRLVRDVVVD